MRKKVIFEMLIVLILGLIFESVFFRQLVFSNFDLMLGDQGDARFNLVILEHWWQVFQGSSTWLSPIFFHPTQGVLGYSDVGFLFALPYSVLRYLGLDSFTSNQIALLSIVFLGWMGGYSFFRFCLKLKFLPSILGTILFSFPNSMALSVGHTQLIAIYFIPYLAIGIFIFVKQFNKNNLQGKIAGAFVAILVPCIFYTSYYIAWFTIFFALSLFSLFVIWLLLQKKDVQIWQSIFWNKRIWKRLIPYFLLSAICFIPFLITYLPIYMMMGNRPFHEILSMLPSYVDYINVGSNNWFWNTWINSFFLGLETSPMAHELYKGLSFGYFFIFLIISIFFIRKMRDFHLQTTHNGEIQIVSKKDNTNEIHWQIILIVGLILSVWFVWLVMLKIENFSIWWVITKTIPGAGPIRAVYRFQQFLIFPISIVAAIGLDQLLIYISHIKSKLSRKIILIFIGLFCLFLVVEQYSTKSIAGYSKKQQLDMLASIDPPPSDAKVFTLLPGSRIKKNPFDTQVDAMVIAQKFHLKTINGYSGFSPPNWNLTHDINDPFYSIYLNRWINYYQLNNAQLYFLDLRTGEWISAAESNVLQSDFYPLMTEALTRNSDFALELSLLGIPDNWEINETRECQLRVINKGSVTLTSIGADFKNPHKYAVKLSYRWVRINDSDIPGFENRILFPSAVQRELTFYTPITAPSKSGSYYLEIEAVQDDVAWFKDKGFPGVRVIVDIL